MFLIRKMGIFFSMKLVFVMHHLNFYLKELQWDAVSILSILLTGDGGALAGVFINTLSDVLPETRRLSRAVCSSCENPYRFKDYVLT